MAEDTGFEPADPLRVNGFQNRRFRPLSQSSALFIEAIIRKCAQFDNPILTNNFLLITHIPL